MTGEWWDDSNSMAVLCLLAAVGLISLGGGIAWLMWFLFHHISFHW